MSEEKPKRRPPWALLVAIGAPALLFLLYCGGYVWVRRAHHMGNPYCETLLLLHEPSTAEFAMRQVMSFVYEPALELENRVRDATYPRPLPLIRCPMAEREAAEPEYYRQVGAAPSPQSPYPSPSTSR